MASPAAAQSLTIVESLTGTNVTACPGYCELAGNWMTSSIKSSAPGTTPGVRSRFATSVGASFSLHPLLTCWDPLAIYRVSVTHAIAESISSNILVGISVKGGSNMPPVTEGFQRHCGTNQWFVIGYLHLDGTTNRPAITFTHVGGEPGRFYADAFRFDSACPCPYLPTVRVNGPLVPGQRFVNVSNIIAGAERIVVMAYESGSSVAIGELADGIVAGVNCVPTLPLETGWMITANQWKSGCCSTWPVAGPIVGAQVTAERGDEAIVLWWEGRAVLEMSTNPAGPFVAIPAASSPYTNPIVSPQQFFRSAWQEGLLPAQGLSDDLSRSSSK